MYYGIIQVMDGIVQMCHRPEAYCQPLFAKGSKQEGTGHETKGSTKSITFPYDYRTLPCKGLSLNVRASSYQKLREGEYSYMSIPSLCHDTQLKI